MHIADVEKFYSYMKEVYFYFLLLGLHKVPAYRHKIYQDIRIIQDNAREVTKSFAELCR